TELRAAATKASSASGPASGSTSSCTGGPARERGGGGPTSGAGPQADARRSRKKRSLRGTMPAFRTPGGAVAWQGGFSHDLVASVIMMIHNKTHDPAPAGVHRGRGFGSPRSLDASAWVDQVPGHTGRRAPPHQGPGRRSLVGGERD